MLAATRALQVQRALVFQEMPPEQPNSYRRWPVLLVINALMLGLYAYTKMQLVDSVTNLEGVRSVTFVKDFATLPPASGLPDEEELQLAITKLLSSRTTIVQKRARLNASLLKARAVVDILTKAEENVATVLRLPSVNRSSVVTTLDAPTESAMAQSTRTPTQPPIAAATSTPTAAATSTPTSATASPTKAASSSGSCSGKYCRCQGNNVVVICGGCFAFGALKLAACLIVRLPLASRLLAGLL